jgi:hypothetical protein
MFQHFYVIIREFYICTFHSHCATNEEVVGSIPDGIIGIFH